MEQPPDLESLYQDAQVALASKDFERATDLLKRILIQDENYKDASRLLAKLVKRQQYRWYRSRWLWGTVGIVALVVLGVVLAVNLQPRSSAPIQPLITPPTSTLTPIPASQTPTAIPERASATPSAMPTPNPLVWSRLWVGQELGRDSITVIILDPTDPDILYVGTENAGIYKSVDGGISWQPVHNGLGRSWIHSIVIDPTDPRTVYAGVSTGGVYKTTDGGDNWFAVNNGIEDLGWEWVASLALDPQDSQHLLFIAHNALFETRNGGEKWTKIHEGYPSECFLNVKFHPLDSQILLAALSHAYSYCTGGISKSEDGGRTWGETSLVGIVTYNWAHQILATDQQRGELVYVTTTEGIFGSRDGGNTWQLLNNEICRSIQVAPDDGNVVYCVSDRILITNDGGNTWRSHELNFSAHGRDVAVAVSPHDTQVLFIGGQGVLGSNDGGETWVARESGLGASRIELTLDPSDVSILYLEQRVGRYGFLCRSEDYGESWVFLDDNGSDLALDSAGEWLYRIGEEGLRLSRDQGLSWEQSPWPLNDRPITIAAHPRQSQRLYITYDGAPGIFISKDGGNTWESTEGIERIFDGRLYFDHEKGDIVYIVGTNFVFRSNDSGVTWGECARTGAWNSRGAPRLVVDPRESSDLTLATRGAGVLISEDGCQSWETSNEGLGNLFVNTLAIDPQSPQTVYAGTDGGAYVSFDGGEHWGQINDGLLGATVVYSIVVDLEKNVYAATPYGIFKLESK